MGFGYSDITLVRNIVEAIEAKTDNLPSDPLGITTFNTQLDGAVTIDRKRFLDSIGLKWGSTARVFTQSAISGFAYFGDGIVVCGSVGGAHIARSTDYGVIWTDLGNVSVGESNIGGLAWLGGGVAIATTLYSGRVVRSTDYGATWTDLGALQAGYLSLEALSLGNGIAVVSADSGSGCKVWRSVDYGATWTSMGFIQAAAEYIRGSRYLGNGCAVLGGNAGRLYRTTDYGLTWTDMGLLDSGETGNLSAFCNLGGGVALAATRHNGKVYRTADYGATWTHISTLPSSASKLAYCGGGVVIAGLVGGGIARSTDSGVTWADLGEPVTVSDLYAAIYLGKGIVLLGMRGQDIVLRSEPVQEVDAS